MNIEALAQLNRKARRANGLRVPVGLVPAGLEVANSAPDIPRYARRHLKSLGRGSMAMEHGGKATRRDRRHAQRVRRAMRNVMP